MKHDRHAPHVPARFREADDDILYDLPLTFGGMFDGTWAARPGLHGVGRPDRIDSIGDFLETYEGPQNGDLDVIVADAFLTRTDEVVLRGVHAAPIGTTDGAAYVWGIDRGAGIELFPTLDPPIGEGVTFDAVVILLPDGTGTLIDLVTGGATDLDSSSIKIAGSVISVSLNASLLPSQGLAFEDYGYNLWPRFAPEGVDPGDNTQVSDFAPDASTFTARLLGRTDDRSSCDGRHDGAFSSPSDLADIMGGGGLSMRPGWASDFDLA
ncbi:hypothetical protein GCM10011504_55150 [Siccirubricoccus deserti]|uniref:Uncharacterized protein n=1 Tax=Siccirubricoccus deserti TaxID=2013562 RepID=A0A9X0UFJ4_9PROT|nr:hypothetical protein [Siccirubricoccus deserti]MBC4018984.1 hypothetical protein [Siccirubricoccus deserti]GGC70311.1 hypothetical protein GCM10011504_55150 [Siccirubricoccus deserti]